jgi:2-keto-4-pentenoate hydratase
MHTNGDPFNDSVLTTPLASLSDAYNLQTAAMPIAWAIKGDSACGMKAGLTTSSSQASFGLSAAAMGQINCGAKHTSGVTISAANYPGVVRLEGEIGYTIKAGLPTVGILDSNSVKQYIKHIVPAIEIVDFRPYAGNGAGGTGAAFIFGNMFFGGVVLGTPVVWTETVQTDADSVNLIYSNSTGVEKTGLASAVEPSLLGVLAQILNHANSQGIALKEDDLFITGSFIGLNAPVEGQTYTADYGSTFGSVSVSVTA